MTLEEKYNLLLIDGRRYYQFDLTEKLPELEHTVPYYFHYEDIEIYESTWNKMMLRIVEELDKREPHDDEWYLNMRYSWSKTKPFSQSKLTNFTRYRDIYLNTNHTSTHSMMSIQQILKEFDIDLHKCTFLIKCHHVSEPQEVKEYYRNKTIEEFKDALRRMDKTEETIARFIKNFVFINNILSSVTDSYNDFFLFDNYQYFLGYKSRVIEKCEKKFGKESKHYKAVDNLLDYLDKFYKNRELHSRTCGIKTDLSLKTTIESEIQILFDKYQTSTISYLKLLARMKIMHEEEMEKLGELSNEDDFFGIMELMFGNRYYFKKPLIAKSKASYVSNDDILMSFIHSSNVFSVKELNDYADTMYLDRLNDYLNLFINISDDFVQISKDTAKKKELFSLSKDKKDGIRFELSFYINSFGKLNTADYKGYDALPNVGCEWNKFLLAGIVRTYLSDTFEIAYIGADYRLVEFEITLRINDNKNT